MPVTKQGRYFNPNEAANRAALPSAARGAGTSTSTPFDVEDAMAIEGVLTITAVAGTTPTLDVSLETTVDGTNWYSVGAFTQKTAVGSDARMFGPLGSQARWKWTVGGTATPSFTFTLATKARK